MAERLYLGRVDDQIACDACATEAAASRALGLDAYIRCESCQGVAPSSDDRRTTPMSPPIARYCEDCAAQLLDGRWCRRCSEVRRLLPGYLRLTVGRAHVRRLIFDLDHDI